jgi:hypothetical protein
MKVMSLPGLYKFKKNYNQKGEMYLKSLQQSTHVTETGFLEQKVW